MLKLSEGFYRSFRLISGKQRRFNARWLRQYPWLKYSVSLDAVLCAPCLLFDNSKSRYFSSLPFNDWKNLSTAISRHETDESHKDSMVKSENFVDISTGKQESVVSKLSSSIKKTVENNRYILRRIIEVLLLLGKQNIAIRGHTEENSNFMVILNSFAQTDPALAYHLEFANKNEKYTSPDIQNELLGLCADQVIKRIITRCRSSNYFAIMADEATDCSTKEQLSVCIRFIARNEGKHELHEEFIGFVTCPSIKGTALAQAILQHVQDCGLDILKLRGQCYDGAGNMAGKYNGVQALIRERVPLASYVHCKSHCLNLALVHTSKLQCVRTMMKTVQDITFAFSYSGKRLEAFANELAEDAVTREKLEGRQKLRTLCETRWTSRTDALMTFRKSFPVVVHALETLEADNDEKAGEHVRAILRFEFIITLVTCEHILSSLVGLTAILQQVDMDLVEAVREANVVVSLLRAEREDEAVFDEVFQKAVDIASEFQIGACVPRQNMNQRNRANYQIADPKAYWRVALYYVFLDHLIQEITDRVMSNQDRFCAQLLIPSRLDELNDDHVNAIYATFAQDIASTRESFGGEIQRWRVRWGQANLLRPSTLLSTLDVTSKAAYPGIYLVLSVLATMPATSASCERSFSSMRRIKSYLRSTMTGDRLSNLGILHIHREIEIDIDEIINSFASVKCRNLDFV
ncbi:zinc finger MYM-type protein 1-like [Mercenaria mercenaria]|uniref:zinc finger MYM-type protein 1-like n=1 Tax=Mercenaria mercenaria TaxID=6596 RepID=UPI00234E9A2C|nr:zinc finger MYM-type protein 1-like [Mercenaria mercenaria]